MEGGERLARFSFLGLGDALRVRVVDGILDVDGERSPLAGGRAGLLDALREALDRSPALTAEPDSDGRRAPAPHVPFAGGLVGVTGYELVRRFERLETPPPRPGEPEAAWVAPRSLLVFDHLTRRAALLHAGPEDERLALRREIIAALRGPLPARVSGFRAEAPAPGFERGAFLDAVRRVQGHITAGDVFQLVLSIRFEGKTDIPPFEAYRALRLLNPSPYLYFLDLGDIAVAGSSPEALVRLEGRRATLRPIAGTRPRGVTPAEDEALEQELREDPKENAEHVMLVDLARNDLGRVAVPGTVEVTPYKSIERYSHVMHMVSGVEGILVPDRDAFDLFAATFPAGTVVGAPKIRAMDILGGLEPGPRGLYAGTVGYFGARGGMDQAIAIRTLEFRDGRFAFQAGAGIVADSVPEREHAEILAKGAALAAAIELAEEGL